MIRVYLYALDPTSRTFPVADGGNVENLIPCEGFVLIKPEIVIEAVRRYQERLP